MTTRTRRVWIALFGLVALVLLLHKILAVRAERHLQAVQAEIMKEYGALHPGVLNKPAVPADQNRAAVLRAATALVVVDTEVFKWMPNFDGKDWNRVLEARQGEIQQLLDRNAAVLDLARKARALRESTWGIYHGADARLPPIWPLRQVEAVLKLAALQAIRQGQPEMAITWIEAGLAVSNSLRAESMNMAALYGESIGSGLLGPLRELLARSEPPRDALTALQVFMETDLPAAPAGRLLASDVLAMNDRFRQNAGWQGASFPYSRGVVSSLFDWQPFRWVLDPLTVELHALTLERMSAAGHRAIVPPYRRDNGSPAPRVEAPAPWWATAIAPYVMNVPPFYDHTSHHENRLALAVTAVALRRYRIETGVYPDSLDALRSAYLREVPVDQITGRPIAYRKSGAGFELHAERGVAEVESARARRPDALLTWTIPR